MSLYQLRQKCFLYKVFISLHPEYFPLKVFVSLFMPILLIFMDENKQTDKQNQLDLSA